MKKRILNFAVVAAMLFFVACSNEEIIPVTDLETPPERTFSLSATVLEPSTRVQLTTSENFVHVKWEVDDTIELAFVSGSVKKFQEANVDSVSNEGKTAHFDITIPEGLGEEFTLYGVYGGLGIDRTTSNPAIKLPIYPGNMNIDNDMVIFFEHTMNASDEHASVNFQHLGALFNINVTNPGDLPELVGQMHEIRLVGVTEGNENWAYGVQDGGSFSKGGSYCLVSKKFLNPENAGNYISFNAKNDNNITLTEGRRIYWSWYPILPGKILPELKLQLLGENGDVLLTSTNSKAVRQNAPEAGNSYKFSVTWVGGENNEFNFAEE